MQKGFSKDEWMDNIIISTQAIEFYGKKSITTGKQMCVNN